MMFLIKLLWIDLLENRDCYGYELVGCVRDVGVAKKLCEGTEEYYPFLEKTLPRLIYEECKDISGVNQEELLNIRQREHEQFLKIYEEKKNERSIKKSFERYPHIKDGEVLRGQAV